MHFFTLFASLISFFVYGRHHYSSNHARFFGYEYENAELQMVSIPSVSMEYYYHDNNKENSDPIQEKLNILIFMPIDCKYNIKK